MPRTTPPTPRSPRSGTRTRDLDGRGSALGGARRARPVAPSRRKASRGSSGRRRRPDRGDGARRHAGAGARDRRRHRDLAARYPPRGRLRRDPLPGGAACANGWHAIACSATSGPSRSPTRSAARSRIRHVHAGRRGAGGRGGRDAPTSATGSTNDVRGPHALGMKAILFTATRDRDRAGSTADAVCGSAADSRQRWNVSPAPLAGSVSDGSATSSRDRRVLRRRRRPLIPYP